MVSETDQSLFACCALVSLGGEMVSKTNQLLWACCARVFLNGGKFFNSPIK